MKTELLMQFTTDKENKQIRIERAFSAPLPSVWSAWTEEEYLDQWWAPRPWKSRTKSMDFREGGSRLYAMVGPEGDEHWALVEYLSIAELKSFTARDSFCDEQGNRDYSLPSTVWVNTFAENSGQTTVSVVMTFESLEDLEKLVEMGFKEGISAAFENLDDLFEQAG